MNTIISIILIILSIATFFFYIDPMYKGDDNSGKKGIKQLQREKQKISFQTSKIVELQKKQKELNKRYKAIEASNQHALDNLLKMIPSNVENARLINYIYTIKSLDGVGQLSDLRISDGTENSNKRNNGKIVIKKEKDYSSVKLAFSFQSNYDNFIKFIDDLYRSLRLVDVVSVTTTQEKGTRRGQITQTDLLQFNLVIRTYWLNNLKKYE